MRAGDRDVPAALPGPDRTDATVHAETTEVRPVGVHRQAVAKVRIGADLPRHSARHAQAARGIIEPHAPQICLRGGENAAFAAEPRQREQLDASGERTDRRSDAARAGTDPTRGGNRPVPSGPAEVRLRAGDDDTATLIVDVLADFPLLAGPDPQAPRGIVHSDRPQVRRVLADRGAPAAEAAVGEERQSHAADLSLLPVRERRTQTDRDGDDR